MNTSIARAFIATTFTFALSTVGCSAQTEPVTQTEDTPDESGEGSVAQVQQKFIACDNDVPATGFVNFPFNQVNYGASSGWKSGCVGFRVYRNLPYPQNVPSSATMTGDFPQFEGDWTATKDAQCRASYINIATGQKGTPDGDYNISTTINGIHAEPHLVYDATSPSLVRITSCTAEKFIGPGCTWFPGYNYHRLDVKAVVNGNPSNPMGPAKVYASFDNHTSC